MQPHGIRTNWSTDSEAVFADNVLSDELSSSTRANKRSSCTMSLRKTRKTLFPNVTIKMNRQARAPSKKEIHGMPTWTGHSCAFSSLHLVQTLVLSHTRIQKCLSPRDIHSFASWSRNYTSRLHCFHAWWSLKMQQLHRRPMLRMLRWFPANFVPVCVWSPACFGALCRRMKEPLTYHLCTQSCWLSNSIATLLLRDEVFFLLCHSACAAEPVDW